jgi:alkylation response protein AidB-like acyl-CoA dehydrogenase
MEFAWTDEQLAYRDVVVRFAQRDLGHGLDEREPAGTFDQDAWQRCADFGLQGLPAPKEFGGSEADTLTLVLAMEALGYGCADNGLVFSLNAHLWACQHPLLRFGNEEQRRRYLPGLCDGSIIGAHGMSEPDSGSDAFALSTTAVQQGDRWSLSGSKIFVTNGPIADLFVIFATTDRRRGFAGLCCFLVERDTPGLTLGQPLDKMGLRTSPMSEVILDNCLVPATNLLGKAGAGMTIFNAAMERERSLILASALGTMERNLERSVNHAKTRRQFGQPIGKFQAVANRLVDMKVRLESSRLMLYRLGWLMDNGKPSPLESAIVKLHLSESFVESSLDALQVHGGYGYMTEYGIERDLRDAIASRIYSGTSDLQRNLAARWMGL